jgi:hypothetical protein
MPTTGSLAVPWRSEIGGAVLPLPERLFNAENLCVTNKGRLFVTGGETVAEVRKTAEGDFKQTSIPVRVAGVPEHCMMTGITAHDDNLYLACARVHRGNNPFIPSVLCDINKVEQTGLGLMLTSLAMIACSVESYIVRANLTPEPVEFAHLVAKLPGRFLANGLAVDEQGTFLYVANSAPAMSAGIYRIPTQAPAGETRATLWCRPGCMPNGVKVRHGAVYYTGNTVMPVMSAVLGKIAITTHDGATEPQVIYRAFLSAFDDFDVTGSGFVIAHFADYVRVDWRRRFGAGVLRFLASDGGDVGVVNRGDIEHPSAVMVVPNSGQLFDGGDIVVTDKGRHRVILFKPDHLWRTWLHGTPTSAAG